MLQYLTIRNLALLEAVSLEFDAGFTAVTGETGAGKSVLLGALGLLSGARTDKTLIRQGCEQLDVEAALYFQDSQHIDALLEEVGLPACDDGVLLLQRSIHRKKMPRVQVNGGMATLTQLQRIGEAWVDFHGPGEPQKLFQERRQLEMLDVYAGNVDLLAAYQQAYRSWRTALKEIDALESAERLDADEAAFVRMQIDKIDRADVSEASIDELERNFARMSSAQDLLALAAECAEGLCGEQGISGPLSLLIGRYESLASLDADSAPLLERAQSLLIELEDLGEETGRLASDFEFDAEAAQVTAERMHVWQEVRRKYGGSVEAVLAKRDELAAKLALQGDLEGLLQQRRADAARQEQQLQQQAARLRQARQRVATVLADKAAALLRALGFKKAGLKIELLDEPELQEFGNCRCAFLFAPNAGQQLRPLNKIASSGESARVMLALKTVLAEADATPLLVFDEVDANVGGEVGRAVGTELARLSARHQVLCVTHLPQVASLAKSHLVVAKSQDDASTTVRIEPIQASREARLGELARMLGDRHSESARAHAQQLLA